MGATVDNWGALVRERVELGKTSKKREREVQGNENQWVLPEEKSRKERGASYPLEETHKGCSVLCSCNCIFGEHCHWVLIRRCSRGSSAGLPQCHCHYHCHSQPVYQKENSCAAPVTRCFFRQSRSFAGQQRMPSLHFPCPCPWSTLLILI